MIKLTCFSTPCNAPCTDEPTSCRLDQQVVNRALWPRIEVRGGSRGPSPPCQTVDHLLLVPFYGTKSRKSAIGCAIVEDQDKNVSVKRYWDDML